MRWIFVIIFAILWILFGLILFKKLNILDNPGPDVPPRDRVPNVQGIVLFIGVLFSFLVFFPDYLKADPLKAFFIGSGCLIFIYLLENFFFIQPIVRLFFQILAASILFFLGGVGLHHLYIGSDMIVLPRYLSYILTVLWIVFFINSVNWFDGINGMASGLLSIGFLTIVLLLKFVVIPAYPNMSQQELERLLFVTDISLVFLIWSFIYMIIEWKPWGILRDVGIVFLAYGLAFLSLLGGAKIGALIVVLSLMIFDAIWVGFYRIFIMKKNPMKGDYTHLHHRLQNFGWTRGEVKSFVLGWSLFWMILLILQGTNTIGKLIIAVLMAVVFFGVNVYLYLIKKKKVEFLPEKLKK